MFQRFKPRRLTNRFPKKSIISLVVLVIGLSISSGNDLLAQSQPSTIIQPVVTQTQFDQISARIDILEQKTQSTDLLLEVVKSTRSDLSFIRDQIETLRKEVSARSTAVDDLQKSVDALDDRFSKAIEAVKEKSKKDTQMMYL